MNTRESEETFSTGNLNRPHGLDRAIGEVNDSYSQAKNFVGEKVQSARKTVDNAAAEAGSVISTAVDKTMSTVNEGIEAGKQFIADPQLDKIADNVTGVIKKYPVQSLFAGIGIGLLIGNALSRK